MSKENAITDRRLLAALDYIDQKYIDDVFNIIKEPEAAGEPEKMTWRTPFKHWKQLAALAACILLLSVASPLVSYIAEVIRDFNAGAGSGTTESLEDDQFFKQMLTEEEYDEMNAAWKKFHGNENINIVKSLNEFTYYYPCQGFVCIYMKKEDLVVFTIHTPTDIYDEITVAGYLFKLPNAEEIWVYKDQNYYSLTKAYSYGILSKEDIRQLSEIHYEHRYGENKKKYLYTILQPVKDDELLTE